MYLSDPSNPPTHAADDDVHASSGGGYPSCVPVPPAARAALIAGLVGAALFPTVYLLDGLLRPGYRTLVDPISALAIGSGGWVQAVNFIVYGVVMVVSAWGWRVALAPGRAAILYPATRILSGLALVATGVVHQGPVHNVVSYLSLIATVIGRFALAARLPGLPGWRGWPAAAVATALVEMGLLAAFGALTTPTGGGGIFEKLATIAVATFIIALTARTLLHGGRIPHASR